MKNEKFFPLYFFCGAILIFLYGLNSIEIIMIDTRFGLFVREMNVASILSPYPFLYGKVYPDYCSLPIYLMYLSSLLTGAVSQMTLTLPSAIASALLVVMTYRIGKKMLSVRFGALGALLVFMSFEFINIARLASIDVYPALLGTLAFEQSFFACRDRRGPRYWLLALLFLAGYAFRGPIGTVIVVAAAVAGVLPFGSVKRLLQVGFIGFGALLLGMTAYFAWTAAVFSPAFFGQVLHDQLLGRMTSSRPFWYYFWNGSGSYAITLPMALIAIGGYYYRYRQKLFQRSESADRIRFQSLTCYFLLIVLGMSIPGTKHLRYIVGALPPAALLAAYLIENPQELYFFVRLRKLFFTLARWLPGLLFAVLVMLQGVLLCLPQLAEGLSDSPVFSGLFWALPLLLLLALSNIRAKNEIFILAGAALCFAVIHITVIEEIEQRLQRTAISVGDFETQRPAGKTLYFYGLGPDGDENKYMLHVKKEEWFIPLYARSSDEIAKILERKPKTDLSRTVALEDMREGVYVMARLDRWQKLPTSITDAFEAKMTGKIGNRSAVLLVKDK